MGRICNRGETIMLGYSGYDIDRMTDAIHDAKLFYLRTPSDLIDKEPLKRDLEEAVSFLLGLVAEGYFDEQ
jgi:hypothetical protein